MEAITEVTQICKLWSSIRIHHQGKVFFVEVQKCDVRFNVANNYFYVVELREEGLTYLHFDLESVDSVDMDDCILHIWLK